VAATLPLTSRKRPRLGDIIEISTPSGFAYAQYTHKHEAPPRYGALLRVLPGLFVERLEDFTNLVQMQERFWVFFPLGAACSRGIVRVVAEEPHPVWAQAFPKFRAGTPDKAGKVRVWFVWDGQRHERVDHLDREQQSYPYLTGIWNDTILVNRIVAGWAPPTYAQQTAT